jgi:uncharacterized protein
MSPLEQSRRDCYRHNLQKMEEICRAGFEDMGSHGWEHVERVRLLCRKIGKSEGADPIILDVAALFHDIMRASDDHALESAEFADTVLPLIGFDLEFCARVHEAIYTHSFSAGRVATSIEAKVLSDADRLDAMGAIGVYRTVQYNLEHGYPVERAVQHIREKLLKLETLLYTETAKKMARSRNSVLEHYLKGLEEELFDVNSSK